MRLITQGSSDVVLFPAMRNYGFKLTHYRRSR
jgi:hypothetical protein